MTSDRPLDELIARIRACRLCRDAPQNGKPPLADPRPVVRLSDTARILIAGQAPGTRVHASGLPFDDPSGDRLRSWLKMDRETFYDTSRLAFAPMGFCFPGLDANGGDLPPRRECAPRWRIEVMQALPNVRLILLVGSYAQLWHLGPDAGATLTETVRDFERIRKFASSPRLFPLPHPSWRNTGWLKRNPWFDDALLPRLRQDVRTALRSSVN